MSRSHSRLLRSLALAILVAAALFAAVSPALGLNSFLKSWEDHYPASATGDAGCTTCHGTSTGNLNAYGKDLCLAFNGSVPADIVPLLVAIEGFDSDLDGNSNLVEIDANAQPGWTLTGNQLYSTLDGGCAPIGAPIDAPAGVPLPYDPPTLGDPVAVPGGPYSGNVNVPISFDGSGSYDSDGGTIAGYTWDFGDGTTGTGATAQHTYALEGTYNVSLTVVDDEGSSNTNTTIATVSGAAVLDLDIAALKVTKSQRVGKPVLVQLAVENPGTILGQAIATVVGELNGMVVYNWRLNVYDYNGGGVTTFDFPAYTPAARGTITWTATIADVDPDVDTATATTLVK